MSISRVSLFIALSTSLAFGQGSQLPKYTVATLPSATSNPTMTVQVINGTSQTDCTVGGGSYNVICTPHAGVWVSVTPSSGSTTNALTANSSGGAAPGDTFNGSAAKTWDYHTFGAQQALTLTTTGTSGPATLSSGALNIPQYSAGASGVQYNPSTSQYLFTGDSENLDDDSLKGTLITVVSTNCNGTVCSVVNSGTNGLAANDYISMKNVTSPNFFGSCSTGADRTGCTLFQVSATGLSPTTFQFPYTLNTFSGTGGTAENANYWLPYLTCSQPFFNGHGSCYVSAAPGAFISNLNTNFSTVITPFVTGTPTFLVINGGKNDIQRCDSAATIEGNFQGVWQQAHAAGLIVVQGTITPTRWNTSATLGCATAFQTLQQVNAWMVTQRKTAANAAGGQYIDRLVNEQSVLNDLNSDFYYQSGPAYGSLSDKGTAQQALLINEEMSTQGDAQRGYPQQLIPAPWGGNLAQTADGYAWSPPFVDSTHALSFCNHAGSNCPLQFDSSNLKVILPNIPSAPCLGTDGSGNIQGNTCPPYPAAGIPNSTGSAWGTSYSSSNPIPTNILGSGTPAAGKYVDGGTGAWTALPSSGTCGSGNIPCTNTSNTFNGGTQTIQPASYNQTPLVTKGTISGVVTPTIVQSAIVNSGASTTWNVAAGTTLVMIAQAGSAGGGQGSSSGDTWNTLFTGAADGLVSYAYNVTGNTSKIISNADNSPYILYNISNVASGNPLDAQAHAAQSTTTPTVSVTTLTVNDLLIGGNTQDGANYTSVAPGTWTLTGQTSSGHARGFTSSATSVGVYPITITKTGPDTTTIFILAFKGASGLAQTADLHQYQDSSGTVLSRIIATGNYSGPTPIAMGTQTISGCSLTGAVGGSWAGQFASGTTGTCTVTITPGITAPNGFYCRANDLTTVADVLSQTATTTTTCTVSGTTVSADVITWAAIAY